MGFKSGLRSSGQRIVRRRRPRQDSNLRTRFRRPVLCPLSYEGKSGGYPKASPKNPTQRKKKTPELLDNPIRGL